jgi:opacity protein-like surface antigen
MTRPIVTRAVAAIALVTAATLAAPHASAQGAGGQPRPTTLQPTPPPISVRGFGEVGGTVFTASDSFEAIFGTASGVIYGGGVEVVLRQGWFVGGRIARFAKDGTRVFVNDGEVFDLGIDTSVTITPIELTGGYRFNTRRSRLVPYVGAGVGTYRYHEESAFATDDEDVDDSFTSYHVLGGAEYRLTRWLGIAGEAQWTTVPDALGQDASSVGAAFDETNLGGTSFRVKVVIGR